jgi:hypothetical protein
MLRQESAHPLPIEMTVNNHHYSEVRRCRISGSRHLVSVLDLGEQFLTGVFPRETTEPITKGPLELLWCPDSGLLQLRHSYRLAEMYGDTYGYRSGLNTSMVSHLQNKIRNLERTRKPRSGDWVIDIGSNDGTLLNSYQTQGLRRVGIDPLVSKFRKLYSDDIVLVSDFFSAQSYLDASCNQRATIITSIAMLYDLEDPKSFVRDVARSLSSDGIWHFEQSYMPYMLRTNSYDTVCHEHLEYYTLGVIRALLEEYGLRIINVQTNSINGGSFAVTACHYDAPFTANRAIIEWMLRQEENLELNSPKPYRQFEERVFKHRADLQHLIQMLVDAGKRVVGYGASTKGNVLLQFCQFGLQHLPAIAEVNPDKLGSFTPGTHIPIISEAEARSMRPDYFLVLPWHFKESILQREREFLASGGQLIFPLPEIEIIGG